MKILFICGCLEPGKDGVGDYTRKLASELSKLGNQVKLVAVKDKYTDVVIIERADQTTSASSLHVVRLPANTNSKESKAILTLLLEEFLPNWVSIQYVGYSFNKRGMPFKFVKDLKQLSIKAKIHVMFHEIWQGESKESSIIKDKVTGFLQKRSARKLVTDLQAAQVSTSNAYYQACLKKAGIRAITIPVFSNIPAGCIKGKKIYEQLPQHYLNNPGKYVLASFFGGFHNHDQLVPRIIKLAADIKKEFKKELLITHVGKSYEIARVFAQLSESTGVTMIALGQHHENDIADFLCRCDIGLSNHPKILYEKSGSNAAILYNKCPVVILRDSFETDNRKINEIEEYNSINNIQKFMDQDSGFFDDYGVRAAAEKYSAMFNLKF